MATYSSGKKSGMGTGYSVGKGVHRNSTPGMAKTKNSMGKAAGENRKPDKSSAPVQGRGK